MIQLYEKINMLCNIKNISIRQLEKLTGLSQNTINNWKEHLPSIEKVVLVAKYFDVSVDYLVSNSDNPKSHKSEISSSSGKILVAAEELALSDKLAGFVIKFMRDLKEYFE